ncbi:patatin-like phospholipase family protein [Xanthomonas translucens]|uniref:patatin-like phospholipase family protein n=1 Tax=Xanthomonas campestris pv. translucens TaxID=343 RepID=UPI00056F3E85|nr:patatin-like phospholipase family protein [Xanthomonas translucens]AKK66060.1 Patatin [Xanthomonas translucens pv. undulosa]AVY64885.1 Patatin [Xanthomonas translucens pv. undulosa]MBC3971232.1 patatin-like phospholipase family protein [Xanthomonas translucens pv. undulosa]MCT8270299.1 patatin-like phospholipase family protein [Xanthomonas translucens pv. undulosa]MCT8282408.1 patatin-like phospholipase family protein [Xanthomonas translucens pv. undulosa]
MNVSRRPRCLLSLFLICLVGACGGGPKPAGPAPVVAAPTATTKPLRIGIALGGGAAKGFAHIGVIKMLQANGLEPVVVSGTSAGSVVGALYASGMDAFQMQQAAVALDETSIRDMRLFSGGLVQGQALQDYVNAQLKNRPIEKLAKPFAAVSTRLEDGERTVFVRGNAGQAVRASSSIPGVFEPVTIGKFHYVDGGVVSPVPVDAARQLGADFVVAVDISSKASGQNPAGMLGIVNQSIAIMGQRLGQQELARADIVIRPKVNDIGAADFTQRNAAILEGEKAALAAMPQIKAKLAQLQQQRAAAAAKAAQPAPAPCEPRSRLGRLIGRDDPCKKQD